MTTSVDMPKRIKIAGKSVQVVPLTKQQYEDLEIYGAFYADTGIIAVYPQQSAANLLDTFLHEILHAIYYYWNMDDTDDEERTVHTMASALQALYVDNQHVLTYIQRMTKLARKEYDRKD